MSAPDGTEVHRESMSRVPAAAIAAQRVAEVRDSPRMRLELLRSSYAPRPGAPPLHLRYRRAALAFMGWQARRGLLNPLDHERPGSPWWRAMNERLLRDTCEARSRLLGHPGPASSPSVEASIAFARRPSPRAWYLAHNVTIVSAYLDHRDLAERENRVERFFINLVLIRLLYAHALVAAPRLALGWLAPTARWLGDPRRAMTGIFLSVSRVLPDLYPLEGELDDYIADEHTIGRLLDVGVIAAPAHRPLRLVRRRAADPGPHRPRPRRHAGVRVGSRRRAALGPPADTARPRRAVGAPAAAATAAGRRARHAPLAEGPQIDRGRRGVRVGAPSGTRSAAR